MNYIRDGIQKNQNDIHKMNLASSMVQNVKNKLTIPMTNTRIPHARYGLAYAA